MAIRVNHYVEANAEQSTTSNSPQIAASLTFTPDANSSYVLIACASLLSGNFQACEADLYDNVAASQLAVWNTGRLSDENSEWVSNGAVAVASFGASPAQQTFYLRWRGTTGSTPRKIRNARIVAIKLDDADEHTESLARVTTTSSSFQDGASLVFTPSTQGEYVILASGVFDRTSSDAVKGRLDIDGAAWGALAVEERTAAEEKWGLAWARKVNLTAASHTIKIQWATQGSQTAGLASQRIVALRVDRFAAAYGAESSGRATTNQLTYQTRTSLTETLAAADHLVLSSGALDGNSVSNAVDAQLTDDGATNHEIKQEPFDASNAYPQFAFFRSTYSAASHTWQTQWKTNSLSVTAGLADSSITVLELTEPEGASGKELAPTPAVSSTSAPGPGLDLGGHELTPEPAASSTAAAEPTLATSLEIAPAAAASSADVPGPSVASGLTLAPAPISSTSQLAGPTLANATVAAPIASATTAPGPTLTLSIEVEPDTLNSPTAFTGPALTVLNALGAPAIASTTSVGGPSLFTGGMSTAAPATSTTALAGPAIALGGATITAAPAASSSSPAGPVVAVSQYLWPAAAPSTSIIGPPILAGGAEPAAAAIVSSTAAPGPTLAVQSLTLSPLALTSQTTFLGPRLAVVGLGDRGMTTAELIERTLRRLGEDPAAPVYYTEADVIAALNEAEQVFVFLTLCLEKTVPVTLQAGEAWYTISEQLPDWIAPLKLTYAGGRLEPATLADLNAWRSDWQTVEGGPSRYAKLGWDLVAVTPQPTASDTLELRALYAYAPPAFDASGSPAIAAPWREALPHYAACTLREKEGAEALQKSELDFNSFLAAVDQCSSWVRARSKQLRLDTLPFDLRAADQSRAKTPQILPNFRTGWLTSQRS